jgi:hypothetical protein
MDTLHITLKKQWFDMIASGEKKEEYREIKPYWVKRLFDYKAISEDCTPESFIAALLEMKYPMFFYAKRFNVISANNGYQKDCPNIKWQHKSIRIGEGNPEWGAEPGVKYFILGIGDIIHFI